MARVVNIYEPERSESSRRFGIRDDDFEQRRPVRGQITKSEARAVSLYSLGLSSDSIVWDIGAGTGSVAVEAARIAHAGTVYAIDRDTDSAHLLRTNVDRFGDGRVRIIIGSAPEALADLPDPDAVFVGGGGVGLPAILETVTDRLKPSGRVVANFAVIERASYAYRTLREVGFSPQLTQVAASRGRELPDGSLRLEAQNPVFIVWGTK